MTPGRGKNHIEKRHWGMIADSVASQVTQSLLPTRPGQKENELGGGVNHRLKVFTRGQKGTDTLERRCVIVTGKGGKMGPGK